MQFASAITPPYPAPPQARSRALHLIWLFGQISENISAKCADATCLVDVAVCHVLPRLVTRGLGGVCLQGLDATGGSERGEGVMEVEAMVEVMEV